MDTKAPSRITLAALGVAVAAATMHCGSRDQQGFGPEFDAGGPEGHAAYGSFGDASIVDWSMPFGGATVTPYAVSATRDGSVRIVGTLSGLATIGPITLNSAGGSDVLVASIDSTGHVLWARNYGDSQDQSAMGSVVDASGNVTIVGTFAGTLDFARSQPVLQSVPASASGARLPGAPLHALGTTDAFVARLDPNGSLVWSTQFGGQGATARGQAVALGPGGSTAITGSFEGVPDFGAATAKSSGGTDAYVATLDASGTVDWVRSFGESGMDQGTALALNPRGEVLVTGNYEGGIDLGSGELSAFGMADVFLAKISATGETVWAKGFGGPINDDAVGIALDPQGNVIALGNYAGDVDLGTGPLPSFGQPGVPIGWDVYVAKYDTNGAAQWAQHFGSIDFIDKGDALAVDQGGDIYVAGHVRSPFTFGQCVVTPTNALFGEAFLGWLHPDGEAICAREYGYGPVTHVRSLSTAVPGRVSFTGTFQGGADFGQGPIDVDQETGFIAREQPVPQPLQ